MDELNNVYVLDSANFLIRQIDSSRNVRTLAGTLGVTGQIDGNLTIDSDQSARFGDIRSLFIGSDGNLYVSDSHNLVGSIRGISFLSDEIRFIVELEDDSGNLSRVQSTSDDKRIAIDLEARASKSMAIRLSSLVL